jgi:Protein of unknown function (DUF2922).
MADKTLLMTFLNAEGSKASVTIPGVKDDVTEAEVSAAMDAIIAKNIFSSNGGDLKSKQAAQITERNVTALEVK